MLKPLMNYIVTPVIMRIFSLLCRIEASEISRLPATGPYIVITNHVNFLEVPVFYIATRPRKLNALAKEETWRNPFLAILANSWGAIPVKRGTADFTAMKAADKVLREGGILVIAPEGTRSGDGILAEGHPGSAFIAQRNQVPVYPVAHLGGEHFYSRLKRLRRTPMQIKVGEPFLIPKPDRKVRIPIEDISAQMMARLARLLPESQRGIYAQAAEADTPLLTSL
ncbi:MAG: 1-acyl-sn-glycerol-3-phosphate acyltransferase [Spirochaetaceae bacterium]|mgnify:CR=1 FL=1|nr:MAG: 1-acyl-sn-glycerol-3-phosphate acyltransferase [Spirochaetaceae bacterium]